MIITVGWVFDLDKWASEHDLEGKAQTEVQESIQWDVDDAVREELEQYMLPDRADWSGTNRTLGDLVLVSWRFDTRLWAQYHDTSGMKADDVRRHIENAVDDVVQEKFRGYVQTERPNWKALMK